MARAHDERLGHRKATESREWPVSELVRPHHRQVDGDEDPENRARERHPVRRTGA